MIVYGEGPSPAAIFGLGEKPGREEDLTGRPFVGRSGELMTRYWGRLGVPAREQIYLTNVVKQYSAGKKETTPDETLGWIDQLCGEILTVQPTTIFTLGRTALQLFADLDVESAHGIPHDIPFENIRHPDLRSVVSTLPWPTDGCVRLFPSYNPAAALHDPTLLSVLTFDFERLGQYCKGLLPIRHLDDDTSGTYDWQDGNFSPYAYSMRVGLDTEGWIHNPWGLGFSDRPGVGRVVRAADAEKFKRWLTRHATRPTIIMHHSLHDLPVLRVMGIDLIELGFSFVDTMIMAYLLGLEPQGLKPLGYRHVGMTMLDYSELTAVSDERVAREWLIQIMASLPEPQTPKSRRKKSDPPIVEYDPVTKDRAHARALIEKMILKPSTIRKRWNDGRAREILEDELGEVDEMPEPTLDDVIEDDGTDQRVVNYVGADPDATRRIEPILYKQIQAYGLQECFDVTMGCIPMFDRMQSVGIKVDLDHFEGLIPALDAIGLDYDEQIARIVGHPINANSSLQVSDVLFKQLRVQAKAPNLRLKRTATGQLTTDDKVLEAIEALHPIVPLIRKRREVTTMKTRYAIKVPQLVDADGRLRCEILVTRTDTGRPAAKNPNLLAWPKHSPMGMLIRQGFVADEGRELGAWDLDQIEMKTFAHDADETNMLDAFLAGHDLHADTASRNIGRPYDDILREYKTKTGKGGEERFAAKATNFGILMGMTEYGLLAQGHKNKQLHWTLEYCREQLAQWRRTYPAGARYIQHKHEEARRYGYVRDMFGRLRWLDGVHSEDPWIRQEAERMAQATPPQSAAQGIMQRAMRNLWPDLVQLRKKYWVEPLLQTYDELLFEYDVAARPELNDLVLHHMGAAVTLKVPVTAKGSFGRTWSEVSQ